MDTTIIDVRIPTELYEALQAHSNQSGKALDTILCQSLSVYLLMQAQSKGAGK